MQPRLLAAEKILLDVGGAMTIRSISCRLQALPGSVRAVGDLDELDGLARKCRSIEVSGQGWRLPARPARLSAVYTGPL